MHLQKWLRRWALMNWRLISMTTAIRPADHVCPFIRAYVNFIGLAAHVSFLCFRPCQMFANMLCQPPGRKLQSLMAPLALDVPLALLP